MTDKKTLTLNESITALNSLINDLLNARNTLLNKNQVINDIVKILKDSFNLKDYDKIFKILFKKAGNTTFYNLYLSRYFKSCHFLIEYNVKKDKIFYIGDIKSIDKTYIEYLEEVKKESQDYQESLTLKDKITLKYKSIDKLDKKSLEVLSDIIKDKLHKKL